ncbi:translation initiation factor IF-2, partial [Coemansia nantahalensis]
RGTLKVGDIIVAGATWCKVRGMSDDRGRAVESAGPATAVKVMGWKDIPQAGDMALQAASEAQAKEVVGNRAEKRKNKARLASLEAMNEKRREVHVREDGERAGEKAYQTAVWEYHNGLRTTYPEKPARPTGESGSGVAEKSAAKGEDEIPVVPIVIKGDVSGTVEAVSAALKKLPSKKIRVSVLSVGVGPVSESDVAMAGSGEQGVVVAFNVKADKKTQSAAKRAGVQIMTFRIIYKLLEEVEQLMLARLPPLLVEEVLGEAVVQEVFEITLKGNKTTNVAGSRVVSGAVARARKARVLRDGKELFMGDISSLKNVKNDIAEATKGQECGISFASFEGLRAGDVVQSVGLREVPQKLE